MQLLFIIHHARAIVKFYSRRKTRSGAPFRKLFREFCVKKMKSAFTPALPDSRLFRTAAKTYRSALSSLIPCTADHAPPCFFRTHPKAPRLSTSESLPRSLSRILPRIGFRCGFCRANSLRGGMPIFQPRRSVRTYSAIRLAAVSRFAMLVAYEQRT